MVVSQNTNKPSIFKGFPTFENPFFWIFAEINVPFLSVFRNLHFWRKLFRSRLVRNGWASSTSREVTAVLRAVPLGSSSKQHETNITWTVNHKMVAKISFMIHPWHAFIIVCETMQKGSFVTSIPASSRICDYLLVVPRAWAVPIFWVVVHEVPASTRPRRHAEARTRVVWISP